MITLSTEIQQIVVLVVVVLLIVLLLRDKLKPAFIFFSSILVFLLSGIIQVDDLLEALTNKSILSIFLLIFITAGIKEHFNLIAQLNRVFKKSKTSKGFMLRMSVITGSFSAFLNNTPIVALFLPYVYQWAKKHKISPSKLLIPLSYSTMVGGMITVIGTSTNLVLNGLIISKGVEPLGVLDFLYPGLLVTIGGISFLYFFGYKMLPNRMEVFDSTRTSSREYMVELKVIPGARIIGKDLTDAGLRNLDGIYLFEIIRSKRSIAPVHPNEEIKEGDILVFAGETENVMELLKWDKDFKLPIQKKQSETIKDLNIVEAVIPTNSELIGQTLKKIEFRENYDAAVIAIHRNGEKLKGKLGEITLQAGDLLLITPGINFNRAIDRRKTLYIVSVVRKPTSTKRFSKLGFGIVLAVLLTGLLTGKMDLFFALILLTSYMVGTNLLSIKMIKEELDISLLVILVSSLAFSTALIESGAANLISDNFMKVFSSYGNLSIIIGIYLITLFLTSFVTNVAAVSIVFPIAYAIGLETPGMNFTALFVAIAFAASASFHSPFSYQTNLMVFGPGGYKLKDFLKIGTPFTIIYSIIVLLFIIYFYEI